MKMEVHTKAKIYPVYIGRGLLTKAKELIGHEGHVFLISEDGIPDVWRSRLQAQYPDAPMHIFAHGEAAKNTATWEAILKDMLGRHLSRHDVVIALGGGVTGDLAGFAAATYMRGVDYVNIPTTTLAQIDSSIGGKTAIDLCGVKNSIGAFWQPKAVIIDPQVLETLDARQFNNGLAEAVKIGLTFDPVLFSYFESDDYISHLDDIIYRCLAVKKEIVERDEREAGDRKLLNFGHTIGHAIESFYGFDTYLHGECVGMGMMAVMTNPELKRRLGKVLKRLHLPLKSEADAADLLELIRADKKADHDQITIVQVDEIGCGRLEKHTMAEIVGRLKDE